MALEIVRMNETHLEEVYAISLEQFKDESWTLSQFNEELSQGNREDFVMLLNGKVVSFIISLKTDDEYNLLYIATKESFKKQGFATILIGDLLEKAKANKIEQVYLEVKTTNARAIRFYEKNGFIGVTTRKNYYKDGSDALLMFNYLK